MNSLPLHFSLEGRGGSWVRGPVGGLGGPPDGAAGVGEGHGVGQEPLDAVSRRRRGPGGGGHGGAPPPDGAVEGRVVERPPPPASPPAQDAFKGPLEVLGGAGVDEGVEAGVEVAQPEEGGEERLRYVTLRTQRVCRRRKKIL